MGEPVYRYEVWRLVLRCCGVCEHRRFVQWHCPGQILPGGCYEPVERLEMVEVIDKEEVWAEEVGHWEYRLVQFCKEYSARKRKGLSLQVNSM